MNIIVKEANYSVETEGMAYIDSKGTTRDVHLFGGESAVCLHIPKGMPTPKILIAAVTMTEEHEPCLDIYEAQDRETAEQFVTLWNAYEKNFAKRAGGYPGMAVIAETNGTSEPELKQDLSAENWLAEMDWFDPS